MTSKSEAKCLPKGIKTPPKIDQQKRSRKIPRKIIEKWFQNGAKRPPGICRKSSEPTPKRPRSRTIPHGPPKTTPGRPPDPQRAPQGAHQTPKGPPKDSQRIPKGPPKGAQSFPKDAQRAPKAPKGPERTYQVDWSMDLAPPSPTCDRKRPKVPQVDWSIDLDPPSRPPMYPKIPARSDATAVAPAAPLTQPSNDTVPKKKLSNKMAS